jgi:hypothetical protein
MLHTIKEWWKKAPQDQKQNLNDTIATLELPTKPKGETWAEFEAWWDQLSDEELTEVIRGFTESLRGGVNSFALEDVHEIERWDRRITVIEQVPMFKGVPRDSLGAGMRRFMDYSDERGTSSIVRVRV